MKATYINSLGKPDQIQIGSLPNPEVHSHEVLIQVQAVSANHVDTFVRSGAFKTSVDFPFVIGRDAVGTVLEVGSEVTKFEVGQLVWTNSMGYDGRPGTYSEMVSVPEERLFHAPKDINPKQLVASVHSAATAAILLDSVLKVTANKHILVEGAAGHVGRKIIELAHLKNLTVSTTSLASDFDYLKTIGASHSYDYHNSLAEIPDRFDYIIDTSGKNELQSNLDMLNQNGQIALITAPTSNHFQFNVREFYMNQKSIKGFVISHATLSQLQSAATTLNDAFAQKHLLDDELLILPIEQASSAHAMLESGEKHEKRFVLTF